MIITKGAITVIILSKIPPKNIPSRNVAHKNVTHEILIVYVSIDIPISDYYRGK